MKGIIIRIPGPRRSITMRIIKLNCAALNSPDSLLMNTSFDV
jgi:hypothetical protein